MPDAFQVGGRGYFVSIHGHLEDAIPAERIDSSLGTATQILSRLLTGAHGDQLADCIPSLVSERPAHTAAERLAPSPNERDAAYSVRRESVIDRSVLLWKES